MGCSYSSAVRSSSRVQLLATVLSAEFGLLLSTQPGLREHVLRYVGPGADRFLSREMVFGTLRLEDEYLSHRLFDLLDGNGDGFLTLEELLVCLANVACGRPMKEAHTGEQKPLPSEMDAKLSFAFSLYDANNDGFISAAELADVVARSMRGTQHKAVTTLAAVGIRSPADRVNRDAFRLIIERSPNLLYPAFALQEVLLAHARHATSALKIVRALQRGPAAAAATAAPRRGAAGVDNFTDVRTAGRAGADDGQAFVHGRARHGGGDEGSPYRAVGFDGGGAEARHQHMEQAAHAPATAAYAQRFREHDLFTTEGQQPAALPTHKRHRHHEHHMGLRITGLAGGDPFATWGQAPRHSHSQSAAAQQAALGGGSADQAGPYAHNNRARGPYGHQAEQALPRESDAEYPMERSSRAEASWSGAGARTRGGDADFEQSAGRRGGGRSRHAEADIFGDGGSELDGDSYGDYGDRSGYGGSSSASQQRQGKDGGRRSQQPPQPAVASPGDPADVAQAFQAARMGRTAQVEEAVRSGAVSVTATNAQAQGGTLLHVAAISGHAALARRLLLLGADPNALDSMSRTPGELASEYSQRETSDLLLAASSGGAQRMPTGQGQGRGAARPGQGHHRSAPPQLPPPAQTLPQLPPQSQMLPQAAAAYSQPDEDAAIAAMLGSALPYNPQQLAVRSSLRWLNDGP